MARISLTQGKYALVDAADIEFLSQWKWYVSNEGYAKRTSYVRGLGKKVQKVVLMHRALMNPPSDQEVDHINGNPLDNRRSNIRFCTCSENLRNRGIQKNNKSGLKGVSWDKRRENWRAYISVNKKYISLGCFKDKVKAALAYNEAAVKYHGAFARLNKING